VSGTTASKWIPTDAVRCLAVLLLGGTAILGHAPASHAATDPQRFEAVERHMGTLVRIVVYTPDQTTAREAFRAGFDRIGELDAILSDYRPDSELNQITTTAVGRPVPVSPDLFTILRASQALAGATAGAFDITQGPVIRIWREARRTGRVPDRAALQEAAARSGHHRLHLDHANRTVMLDVPGMALDVGGIGKGYAASEALAAIGTRGVRSALVAVSGDLAFSEAPPGREGWRVGVHGGHADAPITDLLELTHAAVSTSGGSAQHLDIDGQRYSHIIDPSVAAGLVDDLTVTVIAPHGLEADGLATAVSVLGAERGLALIESQPDTAALVVRRTPDGQTRLPSSRYLALMRPGGASAPPLP
jgi:FAD:protein FMN transferase